MFRPRRARRAVFCARLREENKQPERKISSPVGKREIRVSELHVARLDLFT